MKLKKSLIAPLVLGTLLSPTSVFASESNIGETQAYTQTSQEDQQTDRYNTQTEFSTNDTVQLDAKLKENGYPNEAITIMDIEQKKELVELDARFVSFKKLPHQFEDNGNKNGISVRSLSSFSHSLVASSITSSNGVVNMKLDYNWDWDYAPFYTMTDKVGIAWSGGWTAITSTAKSSYRVFFTDGQSNTVFSKNGYDDYTPGAGIGWDYGLVPSYVHPDGSPYNGAVIRHKGWATVQLSHGSDRSGNKVTDSASGKYFHKQVDLSGSLSFSGGVVPDVSISPSYAYDPSGPAATNWVWTQTK